MTDPVQGNYASPLFQNPGKVQHFFDTGKLSWGQYTTTLHVSDDSIADLYHSAPQAVLPAAGQQHLQSDKAAAGQKSDLHETQVHAGTTQHTSAEFLVKTASGEGTAVGVASIATQRQEELKTPQDPSAPPSSRIAHTPTPKDASIADHFIAAASSSQRSFPADLVPPVNPPAPGSATHGSHPTTAVLQLSSSLQGSIPDTVLRNLDTPAAAPGLPPPSRQITGGDDSSGRASHSLLGGGLLQPVPRSLLNNGGTASAYSNNSERDGFLIGGGVGATSLFDFEPGARKPASQPSNRAGSWGENTWAMQRSSAASDVASSYRGRPLLPPMTQDSLQGGGFRNGTIGDPVFG